MKKVHLVEIHSGLANRMFEYAFYRSLVAKCYNAKVYDNYKVKEWKFEDVSLENVFDNIKLDRASKWDAFWLGGGNDVFSRILRNRLKIKNKKYVACGADEGYNKDLFSINHNAFHFGFYQSEKYFDNIKEEIREAFQFRPLEDVRNIKLSEQMNKCESVALHIRKGVDYLKHHKVANTCTLEYYKDAIKYILENVQNPVFFVFTDNKDWVKENLDFIDYKLVDWNPTCGPNNFLDMQLMSYAKHNIIANSSYSWWGAWLNSNFDKIVIGPKHWFNPECKEFYKKDIEIIPPAWIKL